MVDDEDDELDYEDYYEEPVIVKMPVSAFKVFVTFTAVITLMTTVFVFYLFVAAENFLFVVREEVALPNFNGMYESEIIGNESYVDFTFEYDYVYTDEYDIGFVIDQWPKSPRQVKEGATVVLKICAGEKNVVIPDLTGMNEDDAQDALRELGLFTLIKPADTSNLPEGSVVKTEPLRGGSTVLGETVTLYISQGEDSGPKYAVPNCVGSSSSSASGILSENGFVVSEVKTVKGNTAAGTVISQNPVAGSLRTSGSGVTLTVSDGSMYTPPAAAATASAGPARMLENHEIQASGGHTHSYVTSIVAPNPTSVGFHMHTCTVCGSYYVTNVVGPQ